MTKEKKQPIAPGGIIAEIQKQAITFLKDKTKGSRFTDIKKHILSSNQK